MAILEILRGKKRYTPDEEARIKNAQALAAEDNVQADVDRMNAMGATLRAKQGFNTGDFVDPRLNQEAGRVNPYHVGQEVGVGSPDQILRFENRGVGRLPATATLRTPEPEGRSFDAQMAASGAGNAELNSLLRSRAAAGTTGTPTVPQAAPRMSAREQLAQGPDMQILRMQANTGIGSATQKAAAGRLAQIQAQTDATARQQAEAAKLAGDRQFAIDMKTAPVALAQQGATERQTAQIQADKARYEAMATAYMDRLTAEGKVVGSTERAIIVKESADKLEAEGRQEEANAIRKAVLDSMVAVSRNTMQPVTMEGAQAAVAPPAAQTPMTPSQQERFDKAAQANDYATMAEIRRSGAQAAAAQPAESAIPAGADKNNNGVPDLQEANDYVSQAEEYTRAITKTSAPSKALGGMSIEQFAQAKGKTVQEVVDALDERRKKAVDDVKRIHALHDLKAKQKEKQNPATT